MYALKVEIACLNVRLPITFKCQKGLKVWKEKKFKIHFFLVKWQNIHTHNDIIKVFSKKPCLKDFYKQHKH